MTVDDKLIPDYPQLVIFTMTAPAKQQISLYPGPGIPPLTLRISHRQDVYAALPKISGKNTQLQAGNGRYTVCKTFKEVMENGTIRQNQPQSTC